MDRQALYGWLVDTYGEDTALAFWKWLTVAWPVWGREGWGRLDSARIACPP